MPKLKLNRKEIEFEEGKSILDVCRKNSIKIPTLCYHPDLKAEGKCRQCIVEVNGKIMTSCNTEAKEGMNIITENEKIKKYRKINAGLLMSRVKTKDILETKDIEDLMEHDGLFENKLRNLPIDNNNPAIERNINLCINCGKCIRKCHDVQTVDAIYPAFKGIETIAATPFLCPLDQTVCTYCGQCSLVCPSGAIREKSSIKDVEKALNDTGKHVIIQTAPSMRVSLGEEFGLEPGSLITGKMVTALKKLGFNRVFDTDFGADMTTYEEAHELMERIEKNRNLPMTTSCCPAWIVFMEKTYPELLKHISTCKSPQQMFGAIAKTYYAKLHDIDPKNIVVVSAMPCTAKKFECERKEMRSSGLKDVDYVLTTRELGRMLKQNNINLPELKDSEFDKPLGISSGSGAIFGTTGGVTQAVLRVIEWKMKNMDVEWEELKKVEGIRQIKLKIGDKELLLGVVYGLGNARKVMEDLKKGKCRYDFIEVMACPGGCIGGGGQPKSTDMDIVKKRSLALYRQDENLEMKKAHENPVLKEVYDNFLGKPLSKKAHKYLHTKYFNRKK